VRWDAESEASEPAEAWTDNGMSVFGRRRRVAARAAATSADDAEGTGGVGDVLARREQGGVGDVLARREQGGARAASTEGETASERPAVDAINAEDRIADGGGGAERGQARIRRRSEQSFEEER
jgi:hypothetical protein